MTESRPSLRDEHVARLRAAGLRVTAPRLAVLNILQSGGHLTVEEITGRARRRLGHVSQQAIYDVLHVLDRRGLVHRIQPMGHPTQYEARTGDNHHHLVCRSCGAVSDVDCAVGEAPCLKAQDDHGYEIAEVEVLYWGVCSGCRTQ
ncbi:Fur family transcriptional regulator [Pseudonocardia acidicola]|uniref:Transcriptional repressor n=1 Tax=Pseudonocardia acidicola TaxID=2724939 RepID=A0ABX1S955_9PSEU|nr:Fur family transcriptional regulator [Pseudonocardia acidicola]NMH97107.1 transcriptional repressor [Pseudonocardia acidicola]